jgi:hypothetical protein
MSAKKPFSRNPDRGSILIIAVVFAGLIAVSVASFLHLANAENRLSNIALFSNSSLNLAEAGVEKALFALNFREWAEWPDYSENGDGARMTEEIVDLGPGVIGVINVRIENIGPNPIVVAEGRTRIAGRPDVVKQVEVHLTRRTLFGKNGITTRRGVRFSGGNALVNSYRSSLGKPGVWVAGLDGPNVFDNGSVASTLITADALSLSNSTIYGRVATGGSMPQVGPEGRVYGKDTPDGMKIDPSRVATDFYAEFPMITPPTIYDRWIAAISSSMPLGTPGATKPEVIRVGSIDLSGNLLTTLNIVGPVEIHLTGSARVTGNASIVVASGASAVFYVDGDFRIGGNGMVNATNQPANLLLYGTNPVSQAFELVGGAEWQAAIYAPTAAVSLSGGGGTGRLAGAVVGRDVNITGNYAFHFDEDLGDLYHDDLSFRMALWRELHLAADRVSF